MNGSQLINTSQRADARWVSKVIHLSVHKNNTGNREDKIQEKDLFQVIVQNKYSQGILSVFIWQAPWRLTKQTPFIFFLIQHVGQSGVHISDTSKQFH